MTTQTKYRKYDSESDYYAMGYRMYSAEFGRFLAVDPLFEAMPRHNPYHYSFNSPMFWSDPSGLVPKVFEETIQELLEKKWAMEGTIDLIFSDPRNRADYVSGLAMDSRGSVVRIRSFKFRIGSIAYGDNGSAFYTTNIGYDVECKEVVYSNGTFDRGYRVSNDDGSMSYLESGYFDNLGNEQITERNFNVTTNVIGAENAWLSNVQIALDTYGTIDQGLGGLIAGVASGIIDLYRGNYVDAGISLLSAVPAVGIVGDMWKAERNVSKVAKAIHGNSLLSTKPTWGYKLFSNDGTFLKNGITSSIIPENRYTKYFMSDKYMEPQLFQNRLDAYNWERNQNLINPGPLNFERYIKRK